MKRKAFWYRLFYSLFVRVEEVQEATWLLTSKNLMPRKKISWCGSSCGCRRSFDPDLLPHTLLWNHHGFRAWKPYLRLWKLLYHPSIHLFAQWLFSVIHLLVMASPVYIYINKQVFLFVTLSVHFWAHPSLKLCGPWRSSTTLYRAQSSPLSYFLSFFLIFTQIMLCSVAFFFFLFCQRQHQLLSFLSALVLMVWGFDTWPARFVPTAKPMSTMMLVFVFCFVPTQTSYRGCGVPDNYYCMWPIHVQRQIFSPLMSALIHDWYQIKFREIFKVKLPN